MVHSGMFCNEFVAGITEDSNVLANARCLNKNSKNCNSLVCFNKL
jgi:hypothetical protein